MKNDRKESKKKEKKDRGRGDQKSSQGEKTRHLVTKEVCFSEDF